MKLAVALFGLFACGSSILAQDVAKAGSLVKTTHVFKTVSDVKIHADVYRPDDAVVRPVVVWLHGGALILGSRTSVPKNLLDLCQREGYALVSFDYRLAPEVKLPAIIEDVKDAFRWLQEQGPKLLHIDPKRLVVTGGSAGGYLTMMTGICVEPRPTALVAYWGYGDVDGPWYTEPSEFYRKRPLVPRDEAYQPIGKVLTGTEPNTAVQKDRGRFYLYLRQNGFWSKEVTGFDAAKERARLDPFCPVRNITPQYPPILMIHGTDDTDVPYDLSANMARELARHKVKHELITVEGAGHGLSGGDMAKTVQAHERALTFIRAHLRK